jgi:tellurite resistance protein
MSWWAYSFPLAAITIATEVMFHYTNLEFYRILAYVLLGLLSLVIILLIARTALAVKNQEICVPEE